MPRFLRHPKQFATLRRKYPGVTEEMLKIYIGKDISSQEYYLGINQKEQMLKINWAAFFLAPLWFAYRRLFGWAVLTIFVGAPMSIFANWLYLNRAYKKIYTINTLETDPQKREMLYEAEGRTSPWGVVLFIVLTSLVIGLLTPWQSSPGISGS